MTLTLVLLFQMADFGLSRVLEANATHVSTFTYGEEAAADPITRTLLPYLVLPTQVLAICI